MSQRKFLITKCTLIPNEGSSLDENYDIVRGGPIINYYESIDSPSISMTVTFIDIDQVISRKGVYGGEGIDLTVKVGGFADFKITSKKHKLMLNSVRNVITETNKQLATLEFISTEAIINETARVNKKFTGNVTQTVEDLLEKDKKGIKTKKEIKTDRAVNSYSFVGNLKRPFDTIHWLCPKTQSSDKNFGFLFYENIDGYNFRSIEKLLEEKPKATFTHTDKPYDKDASPFAILQNNLGRSNDIAMNLRMGMYANKTIYIDIENGKKSITDFKVSELNLKKPIKLLDGIEEHPSRLMLRINDFGVAQKGSKKEDVQPESELAVYQNKSYIRNNMLFSQVLQVAIPVNPDLRVGNLIKIRLPLKKGKGEEKTDSYGDESSNDISGSYLISELRHIIGGGKSETQLSLVRDVFTATKQDA